MPSLKKSYSPESFLAVKIKKEDYNNDDGDNQNDKNKQFDEIIEDENILTSVLHIKYSVIKEGFFPTAIPKRFG